MSDWFKEQQEKQNSINKAWESNGLSAQEDLDNLLKARSGVYQNTPENRKKGVVGQHYGKSKVEVSSKKPIGATIESIGVGGKVTSTKDVSDDGYKKEGSVSAEDLKESFKYMIGQGIPRDLKGNVSLKSDIRDTSGMRGGQDKYQMNIYQNGKVVGNLGTHPSKVDVNEFVSRHIKKQVEKSENIDIIFKAFEEGKITMDILEKSWSVDLQKKNPGSAWRTVNGARILVGKGGEMLAANKELKEKLESKKGSSSKEGKSHLSQLSNRDKELSQNQKLDNLSKDALLKEKQKNISYIQRNPKNYTVVGSLKSKNELINKLINAHDAIDTTKKPEVSDKGKVWGMEDKPKEDIKGKLDSLQSQVDKVMGKRNIWIPNMTKGKLNKLLQKETITKNDIEDLKDFKYFLLTDKESAADKGFYQQLLVSQKSKAYSLKDKFLLTNIENKIKQQSAKGEGDKKESSMSEVKARKFKEDASEMQKKVVSAMVNGKDFDKFTEDWSSAREARFYDGLSKNLGLFVGNNNLADEYKHKTLGEFQSKIKEIVQESAKDERNKKWLTGIDPDIKPKKETKQADKTPTLNTFKELAKNSKDVKDFMSKVREIKNVPADVAKEFNDKYGKGKSIREASLALINDVKGVKDVKGTNNKDKVDLQQQLQDLSKEKPTKEVLDKMKEIESTDTFKEVDPKNVIWGNSLEYTQGKVFDSYHKNNTTPIDEKKLDGIFSRNAKFLSNKNPFTNPKAETITKELLKEKFFDDKVATIKKNGKVNGDNVKGFADAFGVNGDLLQREFDKRGK